MRRLPLAVSLLVLVLGACSGGDDDNGSPTTTSTPGAATLRARLLTRSDLPDGFTRVAIEERDPASSTNQYCAELDKHRSAFPGQRVAEVQFQKIRGVSAMYVNEQITQYTDAAEAGGAFADFEKALGQCGRVTKREGVQALSGTFTPVEFDPVGDDTYATSFSATQTVDEDSASISGYFVAFRSSRYVAFFSALGSVDTFDKDETQEIARAAAFRI